MRSTSAPQDVITDNLLERLLVAKTLRKLKKCNASISRLSAIYCFSSTFRKRNYHGHFFAIVNIRLTQKLFQIPFFKLNGNQNVCSGNNRK